jgi:hypothetical protein
VGGDKKKKDEDEDDADLEEVNVKGVLLSFKYKNGSALPKGVSQQISYVSVSEPSTLPSLLQTFGEGLSKEGGGEEEEQKNNSKLSLSSHVYIEIGKNGVINVTRGDIDIVSEEVVVESSKKKKFDEEEEGGEDENEEEEEEEEKKRQKKKEADKKKKKKKEEGNDEEEEEEPDKKRRKKLVRRHINLIIKQLVKREFSRYGYPGLKEVGASSGVYSPLTNKEIKALKKRLADFEERELEKQRISQIRFCYLVFFA